MKKLLYFAIPIVLVFVGSRFYRSNSIPENAVGKATYCNISANEYKEADTREAVIIDVRTQREYDYGHLENAIVIDVYQKSFRDQIAKLDKNGTYYVYCKTGIRSRSAVNYMLESGFTKVCDLEGGINYLSRAGVKLVK